GGSSPPLRTRPADRLLSGIRPGNPSRRAQPDYSQDDRTRTSSGNEASGQSYESSSGRDQNRKDALYSRCLDPSELLEPSEYQLPPSKHRCCWSAAYLATVGLGKEAP